jgi:polar amino acid transport system ATP-binding protein
MTDSKPAVEVRQLHKSFGSTRVLRDLSLLVQRGEVAAIIGPSGSGKSTLLRCINLLEQPDSGWILVDGSYMGWMPGSSGNRVKRPARDVYRDRARMPMVFQRFNLFQHMTALRNVMVGPATVLGVSKKDAEERAVEQLARVGLADKVHSYPAQLSGGQQQRVAIARALAMQPDVILFDEPTSSLDPELVGEVLETIRSLAADGMTMLVVTHEMRFARQTAHRVYFVDEGQIAEEGIPDAIFDAPNNARLQSFMRALKH